MALRVEPAAASNTPPQEWFLKPIFWCGRGYEWIKAVDAECSVEKVMQVAVRILAAIPLIVATALSAALVYCCASEEKASFAEREGSKWYLTRTTETLWTDTMGSHYEKTTVPTEDSLVQDFSFVANTLSEEELNRHVSRRLYPLMTLISDELSFFPIKITIESKKPDVKEDSSKYPGNVCRTVTLSLDPVCKIPNGRSRWEILTDAFYDQTPRELAPVKLNDLYRCLMEENVGKNLQKELVRALSLHPKIEFYFPFNLAYVKTSLV